MADKINSIIGFLFAQVLYVDTKQSFLNQKRCFGGQVNGIETFVTLWHSGNGQSLYASGYSAQMSCICPAIVDQLSGHATITPAAAVTEVALDQYQVICAACL